MVSAKSASSSLRNAGETISDRLLVAMVIQGLPANFISFTAVVAQKDNALTFPDFKAAFQTYEDTKQIRQPSTSEEHKFSVAMEA